MATVTTSIGQGTSHDENAVISAVSGAGPTYTVTIAVNNSVDGDALFDEHATPRKYLIESGGGTTSLTVRDSTGVGSAPDNSGTSLSKVQRYYNGSIPLVDWESELDDTDLYDAADDAIGRMYNDGIFTSAININGGGGIGLNTIKLTVPSSERHDGTAGTGARTIDSSTFGITTNNPIVTVEWLEHDYNKTDAAPFVLFLISGNDAIAQNLILHGFLSDSSIGIGIITSVSNGYRIHNCIVYDIELSDTGAGNCIALVAGGSTIAASILNCTVHDVRKSNAGSTGGSECINTVDNINITIQNCVATDPVAAGSGAATCYNLDPPSNTTMDHNFSSDTTSSGTGSLENGVANDIFVSTTGGSEDLHLKSGADPIDAGVDLGTTPTGVNIDIDGRDRDAEADVWDMGAHEFVGIVLQFPVIGFTAKTRATGWVAESRPTGWTAKARETGWTAQKREQ